MYECLLGGPNVSSVSPHLHQFLVCVTFLDMLSSEKVGLVCSKRAEKMLKKSQFVWILSLQYSKGFREANEKTYSKERGHGAFYRICVSVMEPNVFFILFGEEPLIVYKIRLCCFCCQAPKKILLQWQNWSRNSTHLGETATFRFVCSLVTATTMKQGSLLFSSSN